jgi:glycosyltransferase involved in cell wall biosynthesis
MPNSTLQTASGVAVILISYNRPQMLEYAWRSVIQVPLRHADQHPIHDQDWIILVDDGSDVFDAQQWADEHRITARVIAPHRSLEDRLYKPSLDGLLNRAVRMAHDLGVRIVTYLCDDDLFSPAWIPALRDALTPGTEHVVRGRWHTFKDPLTGPPLRCPPPRTRRTTLDWRQMTTGNFAHRTECFVDENLSWDETRIAVHDDSFLWRMHLIHPLNRVKRLPVLAGWRREHPWNMAHYTQHGEYGIGADKILARGALE